MGSAPAAFESGSRGRVSKQRRPSIHPPEVQDERALRADFSTQAVYSVTMRSVTSSPLVIFQMPIAPVTSPFSSTSTGPEAPW